MVATIGMFDGVHLGHQFVLRHVVEQAQTLGVPSLCITFDQSPRQEQVLTPLDEKVRLIRETGIDYVEVLPFTDQLKNMTARQFMAHVLKERYGVTTLLTGYDNRFGHNREEGFDDYVNYGVELGINVFALPVLRSGMLKVGCEELTVSSSHIRQQLLQGNVDGAAQCLGRYYRLTGRVVHGEHVGTQLGFPTANVQPDDQRQLIPAAGVYAVRIDCYDGMMNIGTRPTFGHHSQTLEVHLLNYDGNLYGQPLTIDFVCRLREEMCFDSPEALVAQLKEDERKVEELRVKN